MKVLTFVIPAYNSEKFLDKCITSMLVPELLDKLEIIVVNDGSTDATPTIVAKYCAQYPDTVRLITQENKGHGGALNTGCAAATGRYLKVIDADDWVKTENLPAFVQQLETCDSDVVLTPHHTIDISTGEVRNWRCFPPQFGKAYTFGEIMQSWKSFDRSLTFHGITYNTAFYHAKAEPLPEHVFYEDHVFATFPCCYAQSVTPLDLFVYEYRIGDCSQSVSRANQLKRRSHTETVLADMEDRCRAMPASDGRAYAEKKIEGLLLSYLTTVLLADPDRREGRMLAAEQFRRCEQATPQVAQMMRNKYRTFAAMNRLGLKDSDWEKILRSKIYNKLRGNHSFE